MRKRYSASDPSCRSKFTPNELSHDQCGKTVSGRFRVCAIGYKVCDAPGNASTSTPPSAGSLS